MNLYFGLFCSAVVLFDSSERGYDFCAFARYKCLTKKLEEKTYDSYSLYVCLFGFYTEQNVNSAANFVFTSKTGLPRVVLVLLWVLFFQKYSSLHSRSLNNICTVAIQDRYWLVNAVGEP